MATETTTPAAAISDLERLRDAGRGPVTAPGDDGYEAARAIYEFLLAVGRKREAV